MSTRSCPLRAGGVFFSLMGLLFGIRDLLQVQGGLGHPMFCPSFQGKSFGSPHPYPSLLCLPLRGPGASGC